MSSVESDDEFPNDFDGLDFSAVPGLQAQHPRAIELPSATAPPSSRSHSSGSASNQRTGAVVPPIVEPECASPSQHDSDGFEVDSFILAAIDEIEVRALQEQQIDPIAVLNRGCPQVIQQAFRHPIFLAGINNAYYMLTFSQGDLGETDVVGLSLITMPSKAASPKTKGKGKAKSESERTLQDILEGYENEITCPICCDVLAAAFMTNPCGHTTCGDCGYGWIFRNRYSPTCSVCRSELIKTKPLLPNYAVDNLVKHHVHALSISGRPEWQERGFRFIEWNKRLDAWKKQYTKILAEENAREIVRKRRYQSRYFEDDLPWLPVEDFLPSPTANNRPRRRTRRT